MEASDADRRAMMGRAVIHIDMDCFYVQVEQGLDPTLKGLPAGVVQYKSYRGGTLIAVGYEARAHGVKRGMSKEEALGLCSDMRFARVTETNGKADLTKYRTASERVFGILTASPHRQVERVSIDEAFLDVTQEADLFLQEHPEAAASLPPSTVLWGGGAGQGALCCDDVERRLVAASHVADSIRRRVTEELGYTCSAGVALNKILAKLATGMNKPDGQTVLVPRHVDALWRCTPVENIRSLGGKLGTTLREELRVTNAIDLQRISLHDLRTRFGERRGVWLHRIAYGHCADSVTMCDLPKSIGCSKTFPGLSGAAAVEHWLGCLAQEVSLRALQDRQRNGRGPCSLVIGVYTRGGPRGASKRRTFPPPGIPDLTATYLCREAAALYRALGSPEPITALALSLTSFVPVGAGGKGSLAAWVIRSGSGGGGGGDAESCSSDSGAVEVVEGPPGGMPGCEMGGDDSSDGGVEVIELPAGAAPAAARQDVAAPLPCLPPAGGPGPAVPGGSASVAQPPRDKPTDALSLLMCSSTRAGDASASNTLHTSPARRAGAPGRDKRNRERGAAAGSASSPDKARGKRARLDVIDLS